MADPICRWRNPTPKTVCEFVEELPKEEMSSNEFRKRMSNSKYGEEFFHTPYQLACQLGLYYEDSTIDKYVPRFNRNITEEEAIDYLKLWISKYYIPNPYISRSSFQNIEPKPFLWSLVSFIEENSGRYDIHDACEQVFKEEIGNKDIIVNALNKYSEIIKIDKNGMAELVDNYKDIMEHKIDRNDKKAFFETFNKNLTIINSDKEVSDYQKKLLTALRTKPFVLLAGISGTGKSRIVRELAFKSCPAELQDADQTTPGNYCMIEVKPNWHDSTELLGYYSNISGKYMFSDFAKFLVKAMQHPDVPFFVCLDEMNLAPVEQYFAEFLSVLETRKMVDGHIVTGALVKSEWFTRKYEGGFDPFTEVGLEKIARTVSQNETDLFAQHTEASNEPYERQDIVDYLKEKGLTLPDNVFVIGTVNMDDTTHQFSRKVIDRAMTIEMNGGDLGAMFGGSAALNYLPEDKQWKIEFFRPRYVNADEVLAAHPDCAEQIKAESVEKIKSINTMLENTPFVVSYRVLNELVIYLGNLLDAAQYQGDGTDEIFVAKVQEAFDAITLMKILPRVEGDDELFDMKNDTQNRLQKMQELFTAENSGSHRKLQEMDNRLEQMQFTRFWP